MIENNTKFEILIEKSNIIEKRRQRLFTILILLPIIFFFLKNSIIEEVNFSIFSIKQINILLLFFPSIFSVVYLYISILTKHNSKLVEEINFIATNEKETFKQYQKEKWLKLIQPVNILANILGSIKSGGTIGCLGTIFVFIPLIFAVIFYPLSSLVYFLIYNFKNLQIELYYISLGNIIFSIWTLLATIIYEKSLIKVE
jgi:hypothetical protein